MEKVTILLLAVSVFGTHGYVSTPGLVKVHEGDLVDLIWSTQDEIGSAIRQTFWQTYTDLDHQLMEVDNGYVHTMHACQDRCEHLSGTFMAGMRIPDITIADAKRYILLLRGMHDLNNDACIFVYQKPGQAQLTNHTDVVNEGDDVQLDCTAPSFSRPIECSDDVVMTYTWTRNNQTVEPDDQHSFPESDHSVLLVSDVDREDSGNSYICNGYEEGSMFISDASEPYVLDVQHI
ncbi:hypothetical protein CAPTEDRAFT_185360 [Capitella teleta]|uniref:Ig-like domain-containing protein n=1 Tax=Capitella teleta TaxID=283909 RepID=R7TIA8_CAPTE|nr:hypothetical protein CAPTEDRAFT_185360 [Capitella teleta]|eukprot:ELT90795.1 hypothetical protein CAPTEDRAFT_185360 [Capitella teleta]